ncbi:hypothetical protein ME763_32130 [Streptomyces murinus]|uniref:hypothetical protein n=1 Tax=Streptomyces murinus TaxID=33900 RepID=UPI000A1EC45E|nr:hypothetical protein [Streptomyces murinus]WDO09939.1 hypothetical protein ME763_32130 [Streptomyces murinus]
MSDEFEQETQELGNAILMVYVLITRVCGLLPIPISLPFEGADTLHGEDMIAAVIRAANLIEDEPIDELIQAGIWGGCLHWLSAAHLFIRYMEASEYIVGQEVRINLATSGEVLHTVAHQLMDSSEE